jgi:TetR/AcrR family transcriptional regulator
MKIREGLAMPPGPQPMGRRERNKQDKLDRIIAAARALFDTYGVDAVTTQQIADKADIGTGTLFLYAKSKSELFLMVQNSDYAEALEAGTAAAASTPDTVEALLAIIRPVVECNRTHVENGRNYLRELIFGDADEPNHRDALALTIKTDAALSAVLCRDGRMAPDEAATFAQIVSAIMFISMAPTFNAGKSIDEIIEEIAARLKVLLPR